MNRKLNKLIILTGVIVFLLVFMAMTSPQKVSLPVLLLPFAIVGIVVYIPIASINFKRLTNNRVTSRIIPVSISSLVVMVLLLSSLGQLTIRDILLVIGFGALFIIYMKRADFLDS